MNNESPAQVICTNQPDNGIPIVRKQIGKTTYLVKLHFSETSKETMKDKIMRLLRAEVQRM